MLKIKDCVKLSTGFSTSVDVQSDLEDHKKVAAFIPTSKSNDVIYDMARNLDVQERNRARVIAGTYGTGKSHLALILARLYRDGMNSRGLSSVIEKLRHIWPDTVSRLTEKRNQLTGKFLLVLLERDIWGGQFDDALLHGLQVALDREGLESLIPDTVYTAALLRIEEIRKGFPEDYGVLEAKAKGFNFPTITALENDLKDMRRSAYDAFCSMHQEVCVGAPFIPSSGMKPHQVYNAVAKKLVDAKGYAGICILWDEFGTFMERIASKPRSLDGSSIQDFARKCCGNSGKYQVHLYLICHRSMQEYLNIGKLIRGEALNSVELDEWEKIQGRYKEWRLEATDHETYELIDAVLTQPNCKEWNSVCKQYSNTFDEITDDVVRSRIFPDFSRDQIQKVVTLGAYPLHPMATFCLPQISHRVAQNERTTFTFLSAGDKDTIGPFISAGPVVLDDGSLHLFTADRLWDFFQVNVSKSRELSDARRVYSRYSKLDLSIDPDDTLGKRLMKAIALLSVIASDRIPLTEDTLRFCLGFTKSEQDSVNEKLHELSSSSDSRGKLLYRNMSNGVYQFVSGGETELLDDKIENTVKERYNYSPPSDHLEKIWEELNFPPDIPATTYNDDHFVYRAIEWRAIDFTSLPQDYQFNIYLNDLNEGDFMDGKAFLFLCETAEEIQRATNLAQNELKHKQLFLCIPKEAITILQLLRRHEALRYIERTQLALYGEKGELRDEWEQCNSDTLATIKNILEPLVSSPQSQLCDWYQDGKLIQNIGGVSKFREAVSAAMRTVFPHTPIIAHDRLSTDKGKDSVYKIRVNVIDKILRTDGADVIGMETNVQEKRIISILQRNGILKISHDDHKSWVIEVPDANENPSIHMLAQELEELVIKSPLPKVPMRDVVNLMRKSPYGMKVRSISVFGAALLRNYFMRGNLSLQYQKNQTQSPTVISKITGMALDEAVLVPDMYSLIYADIAEEQDLMILGTAKAFNISSDLEDNRGSLLSLIQEEIRRWWIGLPRYSRETQDLDGDIIHKRTMFLVPTGDEGLDIRKLITEDLRDEIGEHPEEKDVQTFWQDLIQSLEDVIQVRLLPQIDSAITGIFSSEGDMNKPGCKAIVEWYTSLSDERKQLRIAGPSMILLRHAQVIAHSPNMAPEPIEFLRAISKELTHYSLDDWSDRTLDQFKGMLISAKQTIEDTIIKDVPIDDGDDDNVVKVHIPAKGCIAITIIDDDANRIDRIFVPIETYTTSGKNLRQLLDAALKGMEGSLSTAERDTILVELLKEILG